MKKFALIVAGGQGNRMNAVVPKQFIEICGKPILMHTILAFKKYDKNINIILVLPKNQIETWKQLCTSHHFKVKTEIAFGGENRFQSVKNGLNKILETGVVFIHDGVRPLVSETTISNCYQTALEKGNALPVISISESLRFVQDNENKTADRRSFFLVQTPQTFQSEIIKNAYNMAKSENFTDDASVLENTGQKINLVEGNRENIKITFPEDLKIARALLKEN